MGTRGSGKKKATPRIGYNGRLGWGREKLVKTRKKPEPREGHKPRYWQEKEGEVSTKKNSTIKKWVSEKWHKTK